MFKYYLSAMALKAFSSSRLTKSAYRKLGNTLGGRKRAFGKIPLYYLNRINRMLHIAQRYGVPKNGDKLIELGTGWLHWEAITTRLFFNVHGILFDVWDNRQINGLKNYIKQLENSLDIIDVDDAQRNNARKLIQQIINSDNYEELYKLLGFEYVLNDSGKLDIFETESFDVVVSAGVLEHIYARDISEFINGIAKLLKPGGYSIQSISIIDHLHQYDDSVSRKQYLRYPPWLWRLCFENDVQYINKIQRPDWLELFKKSNLTLIEEEFDMEDLTDLKIASFYKKYDEDDLRCGSLRFVHRKPL